MKPGYKTTEFWMSLISILAPMVIGGLSAPWSVVVPVVGAGAYSIARGLAKGGVLKGDVGKYLQSQP
jgi:hypothetical protein